MVVRQRPLARLRDRHRDPRGLGQGEQRGLGFRVVHAAAGHDQRPLGRAHQRRGRRDRLGVGAGPGHHVHARIEEVRRVFVRLRLHVLRKREGDRARLRGVGQDAHRLGQRGQELLGPVDAVPVPRDRAEAVVDARVLARRRFELLQDRRGKPVREHVAGKEQHRQAVDGRGGRARHHVRGPGADGRRAGVGSQAAPGLGKGGGGVHHGLLVLRLQVRQVAPAVLVQGLAEAGDVAVAEDPHHPVHQPVLAAVPRHELALQELDDRARHGQAPRAHECSGRQPCRAGSRTHSCSGSKRNPVYGLPGRCRTIQM